MSHTSVQANSLGIIASANVLLQCKMQSQGEGGVVETAGAWALDSFFASFIWLWKSRLNPLILHLSLSLFLNNFSLFWHIRLVEKWLVVGLYGSRTGTHPLLGEAGSWAECQPTGDGIWVLGSLVVSSGIPGAGFSLMVARVGSQTLGLVPAHK